MRSAQEPLLLGAKRKTFARSEYFAFGPRLCEKSREPRKRRIVFSIAVSRPRLPVQLVSVSMKLRQMFYTQIERQTFHAAWVRLGSRATQSRLPLFPQQQTLLSLAVTSEKCQYRRHCAPARNERGRQLRRPLNR